MFNALISCKIFWFSLYLCYITNHDHYHNPYHIIMHKNPMVWIGKNMQVYALNSNYVTAHELI